MGASLSINLTQLGKDETNRTAIVNVEVSVTSTGGTHNFQAGSGGAIFSLTVNDYTQSYVAPFGSSETGTFVTNLYFGSFTVPYNSDGTGTCYVSAVLATNGTSAGTISQSASLQLEPLSSSGGGDSGEGGDEPDNPGDSGTTSAIDITLHINACEHSTITVTDANGNILNNGDIVHYSASNPDVINIVFDSDDGYKIIEQTINGKNVYSDVVLSYSVSLLDTIYKVLEITTLVEKTVNFRDKKLYNAKNCSLIKSWNHITHNYTGEGGELPPRDVHSSGKEEYDTNQIIELRSRRTPSSEYTTETYTNFWTWAIKFTTPDSQVNFDCLKFDFTVNSNKLVSDVLYAITSSDENIGNYRYGSVTDSYQLATGSTSGEGLFRTEEYISIGNLNLAPNTTYYLILYLSTYPQNSNGNILQLTYNNLSVGHNAVIVCVYNETKYDFYKCHIDCGTSFELYVPYIDNGTTWKIL